VSGRPKEGGRGRRGQREKEKRYLRIGQDGVIKFNKTFKTNS
jgi:hypothetical protein